MSSISSHINSSLELAQHYEEQNSFILAYELTREVYELENAENPSLCALLIQRIQKAAKQAIFDNNRWLAFDLLEKASELDSKNLGIRRLTFEYKCKFESQKRKAEKKVRYYPIIAQKIKKEHPLTALILINQEVERAPHQSTRRLQRAIIEKIEKEAG